MLDSLKQLFLMTWLWSAFAGFYLLAYTFWIPRLLASLPLVVLVLAGTLALGFSVLVDGFSEAVKLQTGRTSWRPPFVRVRRLAGGLALLVYGSVYLPSGGRVVAHWPLDLAITVVSGVVMVAHGVKER